MYQVNLHTNMDLTNYFVGIADFLDSLCIFEPYAGKGRAYRCVSGKKVYGNFLLSCMPNHNELNEIIT
jgi:hypothetical protein